jgi:hypothetical protein
MTVDFQNEKFYVDGEEFPWTIDDIGPLIEAEPGSTRVTVTMYTTGLTVKLKTDSPIEQISRISK